MAAKHRWLSLLLLAAAPPAAAREIALEEALAWVARSHPQLQASAAEAEAAEASVASARGHLLPAVRLGDKQIWSLTSLTSPGFLGALLGGGAAEGGAPPTNIAVNLATIGASQPLLGLGRGSELWRAQRHLANARQQAAERDQRTLKKQVQSAYLRLFEARALEGTAAASLADLEAEAATAQRKVEAGTLTRADVLRVQVAAAMARQRQIEAAASAAATAAGLVEMLGLGEEEEAVTFAEPTALLAEPPPPPPLEEARSHALDRRLELRQADSTARAAHHSARAQGWALLPELSISASYMFANLDPFGGGPQGSALRAHTAMFGVALDWAVWEWGSTWYQRQRARAEARAAVSRLAAGRREVAAEVAARHHALLAARAGTAVANLAVAAAAEAWRVVQALVQAGSATTTDLLSAEAARADAAVRQVQARTAAALAQVELDDAVARGL